MYESKTVLQGRMCAMYVSRQKTSPARVRLRNTGTDTASAAGHEQGRLDQRTFAQNVLLILSLRPFPWPGAEAVIND